MFVVIIRACVLFVTIAKLTNTSLNETCCCPQGGLMWDFVLCASLSLKVNLLWNIDNHAAFLPGAGPCLWLVARKLKSSPPLKPG